MSPLALGLSPPLEPVAKVVSRTMSLDVTVGIDSQFGGWSDTTSKVHGSRLGSGLRLRLRLGRFLNLPSRTDLICPFL